MSSDTLAVSPVSAFCLASRAVCVAVETGSEVGSIQSVSKSVPDNLESTSHVAYHVGNHAPVCHGGHGGHTGQSMYMTSSHSVAHGGSQNADVVIIIELMMDRNKIFYLPL